MLAELRAGALLFVVLSFFILILMVLVLGSIMKPDRWGKRSQRAGKARSNESTGFSTAT
jgi:uncharacterized membrane protein